MKTVDSYPEVTSATTDNVDDEGEEMEECVNEEYIDDQAMDYTSDETDSTDDGPVDASKVDSSASDDELFDGDWTIRRKTIRCGQFVADNSSHGQFVADNLSQEKYVARTICRIHDNSNLI